jgi:NAD-dependent DNA ligase
METKDDKPNGDRIAAALASYLQAYERGAPLVSDAEYDAMVDELRRRDAAHPFLRHVGTSPPRGRAKVHAWRQASLDKVVAGSDADARRLMCLMNRHSSVGDAGSNSDVHLSPKADGISAAVAVVRELDGSVTVQMVTRGDGRRGQDQAHLLPYVKLPELPEAAAGLIIRGELVIPRGVFEKHLGGRFKNARNVVAGQANATEADADVASHIRFVAYQLLRHPEAKELRPTEALAYLRGCGFETVDEQTMVADAVDLDTLHSVYAHMRQASPYDLDGVVVQVNTYVPPMSIDSDGNPKTAFAYKEVLETHTRVVKVARVDYRETRTGPLIPVVIFEKPTPFPGCVVKQVTAHNAGNVQEHGIGPGAMLCVSHEVIPVIRKVLSPSPGGPQMPDASFRATWDASHTHLMTTPNQQHAAVHFGNTFRVPGLGFKTLNNLAVHTLSDLLYLSRDDITAKKGFGPKRADAIHTGLRDGWRTADAATRIAASGTLGTGFGVKRIALIVHALPGCATGKDLPPDVRTTLNKVPGLKKKTIDAFCTAYPKYQAFLATLPPDFPTAVAAPPAAPPPQAPAQAPATAGSRRGRRPAYPPGTRVVLLTGFTQETREEALRLVQERKDVAAKSLNKSVTHVVKAHETIHNKKTILGLERRLTVMTYAEYCDTEVC